MYEDMWSVLLKFVSVQLLQPGERKFVICICEWVESTAFEWMLVFVFSGVPAFQFTAKESDPLGLISVQLKKQSA